MSFSKTLSFLLAFLLVNLQFANASSILGKVAVQTSSQTQTYPLISGDKVAYKEKALVKIAGGSLVLSEGAEIRAIDEGEKITFQIEKGTVYFRLLPHKIRISFKTAHGDISTPRVVPTSASMIEGGVTATQRYTMAGVTQGSLSVLPSERHFVREVNGKSLEVTSEGTTEVESGQTIKIAQADIEDGEGANNDQNSPEEQPGNQQDGSTEAAHLTLGTGTGLFTTAVVTATDGDDDEDDEEASPIQ